MPSRSHPHKYATSILGYSWYYWGNPHIWRAGNISSADTSQIFGFLCEHGWETSLARAECAHAQQVQLLDPWTTWAQCLVIDHRMKLLIKSEKIGKNRWENLWKKLLINFAGKKCWCTNFSGKIFVEKISVGKFQWKSFTGQIPTWKICWKKFRWKNAGGEISADKFQWAIFDEEISVDKF